MVSAWAASFLDEKNYIDASQHLLTNSCISDPKTAAGTSYTPLSRLRKGFCTFVTVCGGLRSGTGFTLLYYFALVVEATPCNGKLCVFWFRRCLEALQGFDSPCFLWLNLGKDSCQSRQSCYNRLMSDVGRTKP